MTKETLHRRHPELAPLLRSPLWKDLLDYLRGLDPSRALRIVSAADLKDHNDTLAARIAGFWIPVTALETLAEEQPLEELPNESWGVEEPVETQKP